MKRTPFEQKAFDVQKRVTRASWDHNISTYTKDSNAKSSSVDTFAFVAIGTTLIFFVIILLALVINN